MPAQIYSPQQVLIDLVRVDNKLKVTTDPHIDHRQLWDPGRNLRKNQVISSAILWFCDQKEVGNVGTELLASHFKALPDPTQALLGV